MTTPRLPPPAGLLIDREQTVEFSFEGVTYSGLLGDSIASALVANGQWLLSRSFKYHRPRGPLTMAGQDANTLIQLAGEPNVLADRENIVQGLAAMGQNYTGSLVNDRDAVLDKFSRFLPVGFYYRAFFKPRGVWRWWENYLRKKAGLGKLDLTHSPEYYDKQYLFCDLAIIGGGPAGISAALTAAEKGVRVLLIEESDILGGALSYQRFHATAQETQGLRENLLNRLRSHENIQILTGAVCNGWFKENYLSVIKGKRLFKVRARECILATGCFEQHLVFRNNDLPGVVMTSAALRLIHWYAVKPAERAVIVTVNDDGYQAALALHEHGINVVCVVDLRPQPQDETLAAAVGNSGIDIKYGQTIYCADADKDQQRLKSVEVRKIVAQGQVEQAGATIACDLLCMSGGYMPAYQLPCQAGAKLNYQDDSASFCIANLPKHCHIAGAANDIHELSLVFDDGKRAALAALSNLGVCQSLPDSLVCSRQVNLAWPIFAHPKGKEFIDYDEDLHLRDIVNATRLGYRDVQLVKRFSTVGMGPSQGRHSALATARIVAQATERTVSQTGVTTARPPFAPEKLAHLAGRRFDPYRRTAMHQRHLQLGAQMMPAGAWQRPAFYGAKHERDACVKREVAHVRNKVGIIDVSTLGGLEIRGTDAAEFMNRMYTFAFLKQPVGKTRYAIMTSEQGVVIDDGVACRLADDHFYVTATTSAVDRVYRDMTRWNAQWRLDVDIYNVTSAFAAVNVAGPAARQVLSAIIKEVDLSAEAFPYLAYREGSIFGVTVRMLRVGFVGELGYELHIPAQYGEALWDSVMQAGEDFDIKPFGVEAQRLLRLEKGHIIVGQDTDGMSHPTELDLDWAVNRKKPFFIGKPSVAILTAGEQSRRLVGFSLPADSVQPKEGHLVLQADDVVGNVTSCEFSPTLNRIIGMAYAHVDNSQEGSVLDIRVDGGAMVQAKVTAMPFFDPNNSRQEA